MVIANGHVDLDELKGRHPLGDVVEAAGVRLRGRGRVRQGVCPFHDEAEGSFTVYGDSERYYCFGCGRGGDVLDLIQDVEGLSLPQAIQRLGGGAGLASAPAVRSRTRVAPRRPSPAVVPQRDPALLTAALRFYLRSMLRSREPREYLGSRASASTPPAAWGLASPPGRAVPIPRSRRVRRRAGSSIGAVHRARCGALRRDGGGPGLGLRQGLVACGAGRRP